MVDRKSLEIKLSKEAYIEHKNGKISKSLHIYKKILKINPQNLVAMHGIGVIKLQEKKYEESIKYIDAVLKINFNLSDAHYHRGCAYIKLSKYNSAIKDFSNAIIINEKFAEAYYNRGVAYSELNLLMLASNDFKVAFDLNEKNIDAIYNYATTLTKLRRYNEALEAYLKVLKIDSKFFNAYINRGKCYFELRKYELAIIEYDAALKLDDGIIEAYCNYGYALVALKRFAKAIEIFKKAYKLNPLFKYLPGVILNTKMNICDWSNFDHEISKYIELAKNESEISTPFAALSLIDDSRIHALISRDYVKSNFITEEKNNFINKRREKIKIGYYSSDFYNHATSYLIIELIERHDKSKFEIFGFTFGPQKNDEMSTRLSSAFCELHDVSNISDDEIVKLSKKIGIDIAVDLKGHTKDSRFGIFTRRCAPIQINYLGYPGTLGSNQIDYIIADKIVLPKENIKNYFEKVIYLPNSYQANDSKRKISNKQFTRSELGLPESSFVFTSFNNNYKTLPSIFDSWMRILQKVEDSVLWLYEDNSTAAINLKIEAERRGVNSKRLIFADRMDLAEHLSRHKLADLFLDTFPYNAHTTASDALWAGLPLITVLGESFASRVAASLLSALNLNELITYSQNEYEELAVELATNQNKLQTIKKKLEINIKTSSLFKGSVFAENLENAYLQVYERYKAGLAPDHIEVQSQRGTVKMIDFKNKVFDFLSLNEPIQVLDIGASIINESPIYKKLLDNNWALLNAFDGDERQIKKIKDTYGEKFKVWREILFDGTEQTLYMTSGPSGMTSLFKPKEYALRFFNGFKEFGKVEKTQQVQTVRLDSILDLPLIDFIKLDIQGAELAVLQNGIGKINNCVAIQLEVSYFNLYENQPSFGEVDTWMRTQGFVPHCFLDVKRWSIAPTIFNNNFRVPGNQLLESDIVYIKDPLKIELLNVEQIKKLIVIAHHCFKSYDLCVYLFLELSKRIEAPLNVQNLYLAELSNK